MSPITEDEDDGIPLGAGRWYPDEDSGPDKLAREAGCERYGDYADLRAFIAELEDVNGPWDLEAVVALRKVDDALSFEGDARDALAVGDVDAWVRWRGRVAHAEGVARAWCDLARFP
jgi:hypothetical protein